MSDSNKDPNKINAMPTKRLFIEMLVKDVDLVDAINDLTDNSIDGATRLRGEGSLQGLEVALTLRKGYFQIKDDCGGIPYLIARDYAFRFGRPEEADEDAPEHSVGRFGIGMKRALFKLGKNIKVSSTSNDAKFVVVINVDQWKKEGLGADSEMDNWAFKFEPGIELRKPDNPFPEGERGTTIEVTDLYPEVDRRFEDPQFITGFENRLKSANTQFVKRGLSISVNGRNVTAENLMLLSSDNVKPAFHQEVVDEETEDPILTRYYAGLMGPKPSDEAGWYVFCNGRMILRADRSSVVGWGDSAYDVPRFHNQYARFRGYAFFDCDDPAKLPWNTTKTGLDRESSIYARVRRGMLETMSPVIKFINELDDEKDTDDKTYHTLADQARPVEVEKITEEREFSVPERTSVKVTRYAGISYKKPAKDIELLKQDTGARNNTELGEITFDYYVSNNL